MILRRSVPVMMLLLAATFCVMNGTRGNVIGRQNYGYMLRSVGNVQLTSGRVRLIFHFDFPRIIMRLFLETVNCSQYANQPRALRNCVHFRSVVNNLFETKRDIVHLLSQRMKEIDELLDELPKRSHRRSRSIMSWIGGGIADIFGLAKFSDLEDMQDLLQRVLDGTQQAVEAFSKGQNLFTRITKLTNERFENVERMLNISRWSIIEENRRLETLRNEFNGVYKIIGTITREIHLAIRHVQETEALYLGIQQLVQGHLSHHLVSRETLHNAILDMRDHIRQTRPDMQLVHTDVKFYYECTKIGAVIHTSGQGHVIFIVVHAPVTLQSIRTPLKIWSLTTFPLQSPDGQGYYTLLNTRIKYYIVCVSP